jgi:NUMOD4 motif-containing protein/HNH endonuclease
MIEIWMPVPGYEGFYEVSDLGRIYSHRRWTRAGTRGGRILKPAWDGGTKSKPHQFVSLFRDGNGKGKQYFVHRLVLLAFVGEPPDGMIGCHRDDDPANNCLENLRWDTPSENMRDCIRNGNHNHADKRFCKYGHEFTPENTYTNAGKRYCRKCMTRHQAKYRERKRQRALQDPA